MTIDEAIMILNEAKAHIGGDAMLILSLTESCMADCDVNDMVVQSDDGENRYVEVRVKHPELAKGDWIIYYNNARMLFDAVPDPLEGAIGSNWQPVDSDTAKQFIAKMGKMKDWSRGHWNPPRF